MVATFMGKRISQTGLFLKSSLKAKKVTTWSIQPYVLLKGTRGGFKTQPPVDQQFRPVPGGCHCLEQRKPAGTVDQPAVGFEAIPKFILLV